VRKWVRIVLGAVVLGAGAGVVLPTLVARANPPVPPPAGAIVTGTSGPTCPSPTYATIQSAINAAPAGATIYVCAGTYNESPTINKPLILDGAQYDVDARTRAGSTETVVNGSGGISFTAGATSGTVNGFTLEGYTGTAGAITATGVGAGWRFVNNVIDVSTGGGVDLNTDGLADPAPSSVTENLFTQSTPSAATTGDDGQAVLLAGGTAHNVTVANNNFVNLSGPGAAIDTTGTGACGATLDATNFSNDVVIASNSLSEDGASFTDPVNGPGFIDERLVNLVCTNDARVRDNTVTITDSADTHARGPIDLAGGDWSTPVDGNTLSGNGASNATGVDINSDSYPPGSGITVQFNDISGFRYGIDVRAGSLGHGYANPSGFTVKQNQVSSSTADGIAVQAGSGGTLKDNAVSGSTTDDCLDATTGSGTAGTADTWTADGGTTSSPAGLCSSFVAPSLSVPSTATATVGTPFNLTVTAAGYPVPSVDKLGSVPRGLKFVKHSDGTATISGTPSVHAAGLHVVTIRAANSADSTANVTSASMTIAVDEAPAVISRTEVRAVPGKTLTFTVRSRGYPAPALHESGSLPPGVTFVDHGNGTATLSGTPTAPLPSASWPLTITATNILASASQTLTLTTDEASTFTSPSSATATVGVPFDFTVTTAGPVTPVITEGGALPPGVTFVDHGNGTATLSGTAAPGSRPSYPITLVATTGTLHSTAVFTLHVDTTPVITGPATKTVSVGTPFSVSFSVTGYPRPIVTASGALPSGVTFVEGRHDRATLAGVSIAKGTWTIVITATNTAGSVSQDFQLVID
jgi:parallel beta-helix repeat protein